MTRMSGASASAADRVRLMTAALLLLSDAASFITGEDLNVSGGMVMF